jgi:hypothetical protein
MHGIVTAKLWLAQVILRRPVEPTAMLSNLILVIQTLAIT